MTEVSLTAPHRQPPGRAGLTARPSLTLAEEHALVLWQVTTSAEKWYLLTEGSVVDLDALPPGQAAGAVVDRLLRMRRGEQVELRSGTGLDPVWREISELCPGGYQFTVLQDGPAQWRMQVTRRQTAV